MSLPRVGIVVLHYGRGEDTAECLASIARLRYPNFFTLVVDQPGEEGTDTPVCLYQEEIQRITPPRNEGWAGGNNRGVREAWAQGAEYVLLLNNDTVVDSELLNSLVAVMERERLIGVLGPAVLRYDAPDEIWAAGGGMEWPAASSLQRYGEPYEAVRDCPIGDVGFVIGCAMLIRRRTSETVGPFEERFFLYYEDADFSFRVRAAGERVCICPGARVWHKASRSTGGPDAPAVVYYMRRNAFLFAERHCRPNAGRAWVRLMGEALRLAACWTWRGTQAKQRAALMHAVRDHILGRYGQASRQT